jgi:hypothetical protein
MYVYMRSEIQQHGNVVGGQQTVDTENKTKSKIRGRGGITHLINIIGYSLKTFINIFI